MKTFLIVATGLVVTAAAYFLFQNPRDPEPVTPTPVADATISVEAQKPPVVPDFHTPDIEAPQDSAPDTASARKFRSIEDYSGPREPELSLRCGMGPGEAYALAPIRSTDIPTKQALADTPGHGLRGCAAWHLALRYAVDKDMEAGANSAVLASVVLDSAEPIIALYENFWTSAKTRPQGVPYLLFAEQNWPENVYLTRITARITSEERKIAATKLAQITDSISQMHIAKLAQ